jgi:hypothetical protein
LDFNFQLFIGPRLGYEFRRHRLCRRRTSRKNQCANCERADHDAIPFADSREFVPEKDEAANDMRHCKPEQGEAPC